MHTYRTDIDGLRALAVLAVIFGHGFEAYLPSGYLGVDVFFVISGFVIAQSLMNRQADTFRTHLFGFFLRRFKRLLPALLICFVGTSLTLMFIDAAPKVSLITGALALFGFSNIYLYDQELDYFSAAIEYNAFSHTWSLGVEEQFYLLFPVVFWILARSTGSNFVEWLGRIIAICSLLSLIAFVALEATAPVFAYYIMFTRFWEIGAGVVIACILHRGFLLPQGLSSGFAICVYLLILLSVFFFLPAHGFVGHLVAVAATAAVIWAGARTSMQHNILTHWAVVYVGKISYSLYLWHWPFLVFGLLALDSWVASPAMGVLATFILSALSYHFIEQPVRKIATPTPRLWHFATAFGGIFSAIVIVAAANEYRKNLPSDPFESALRGASYPMPGSNAAFHHHCVINPAEPQLQLQSDTYEQCTFDPVPGGDPRMIWILGDSHAGHLQGGIVKLREKAGFGFHLVETPGQAFPSTSPEGFPIRDILMTSVREQWKPGDIVVLSRLLLTRTDPPKIWHDLDAWYAKIDLFAEELAQEGIDLVLVGPSPMFRFEDLRACNPQEITSCAFERHEQQKLVEDILKPMNALATKHKNIAVLDIFEIACPAIAPLCSPLRESVFIVRDRDHLNVYGAELMMEELHQILNEFKN